MSANGKKPKLAVWKFSSCDGCQLSLLDCEDELLAVAGAVDIAYFLEATSATAPGPYDVSLVEGSITTPHDAERIREIRKQSKVLVTIGACATAGGIQALKNFADVDEYIDAVYATPEYISTLATSTAIADHVDVDFELRGCPINKHQLLEVVAAFLHGRRPERPRLLGLHGVQAARDDLRDGRPRDAVPRPGHAGRLRRDLPFLRPRLLRLLRPDGDPEHRGGRRPAPGARDERAGARPRLPHLQRERAGLPGGEQASHA